jgi:hypothetical protein
VNAAEARLVRIRGRVLAKTHNARTIAALASNPGCARRAILDAARADKQRLAAYAGFPAPFGQSRFALARGNAFEAQVKADGAAELLTLLRAHLNLPIPEAHYDDLSEVGGSAIPDLRHARTRTLLARAARSGGDAGTMFDHPLLRLEVGGRHAFVEPDLIAFQLHGRYYVIEIKSFAVIDGQADPGKVAAAAIQSAVYVRALRDLVSEAGGDPAAVSHATILVAPRDFSSQPTAASLDVRRQLGVLDRQLSRIASIEDLIAQYPPALTFDLDPDPQGRPRRPAAELTAAIGQVTANYAPECLATCELCFLCRDEAAGSTGALGKPVREDLGGIEYIAQARGLARGQAPAPEQAEIAALLLRAAGLREQVLAEAVEPP